MAKMKPMEILVLDAQENKFKWVKVESSEVPNLFSHRKYVTEDATYSNNDIYNIKNDVRKKYVYCSNCRTLVAKDKVDEHDEKARKKAVESSCLKCEYAKMHNVSRTSKKIIRNQNGQYISRTESVGELKCARTSSYNASPLSEAQKKLGCCKYNKCGRGSIISPADIIVDCPDMFARIATVNALNKSGRWKFRSKTTNGIIYGLGATNLTAICNKYGMITRFDYYSRSSGTVQFRYSAKLDKFYLSRGGRFEECTMYQFPDSKSELWKKYIRNLYKEEE